MKKTSVKKKNRKTFVTRPKKPMIKQERNSEEDCHDNTDNEAVLMENKPEMVNTKKEIKFLSFIIYIYIYKAFKKNWDYFII